MLSQPIQRNWYISRKKLNKSASPWISIYSNLSSLQQRSKLIWSLKMSTKSYQKPQFGKICQNSNFTLDSLYQFCMQNWHTLLAGFLTDLIIAYSSVVKWVKVRVYTKMKIVFFYLKKKKIFFHCSIHPRRKVSSVWW